MNDDRRVCDLPGQTAVSLPHLPRARNQYKADGLDATEFPSGGVHSVMFEVRRRVGRPAYVHIIIMVQRAKVVPDFAAPAGGEPPGRTACSKPVRARVKLPLPGNLNDFFAIENLSFVARCLKGRRTNLFGPSPSPLRKKMSRHAPVCEN